MTPSAIARSLVVLLAVWVANGCHAAGWSARQDRSLRVLSTRGPAFELAARSLAVSPGDARRRVGRPEILDAKDLWEPPLLIESCYLFPDQDYGKEGTALTGTYVSGVTGRVAVVEKAPWLWLRQWPRPDQATFVTAPSDGEFCRTLDALGRPE